MMTASLPLLKAEIRDLSFWFGLTQVLTSLTLPIAERRITALIGPSGCGKTTFLRCLNRMHDVQPNVRYAGEIVLYPDKINILDPAIDPIEVRMRIGMVFQKPNPFPASIFDNVVYGLRIRGVKDPAALEERAVQTLQEAALWEEVKDRLHSPATALSGGQQQRLCMARALAVHPEMVLFDEPTSALDPVATAKIEELMTRLKDKVTIVIVTHNMQQAARVSDYTAFMFLGKLIEVDRTETIFTNPSNQLTEEYVTGRFG